MAPGLARRADGLRLGRRRRRRRRRAGAVSCPSGLLSYEYFTGRGGGLPGGRDPAGRCRRPRLRGPGRSTRTYKLTSPRAVSPDLPPRARPPAIAATALWTAESLRRPQRYILPRRPLYTTLFTYTHTHTHTLYICM